MQENPKTLERISKMAFATVYPLYIAKAEKKWRSKKEVDAVIFWLTGYDNVSLQTQIDSKVSFETFFAKAPLMNPLSCEISGTICGVKIQEIQDPLYKNVRILDKLVDELAKGKSLEKILKK